MGLKTQNLSTIDFSRIKLGPMSDNSPAQWRYDLPNLNSLQQGQLLTFAREAIITYLQNGCFSNQPVEDPMLRRCAGVFVTLWRYEHPHSHKPPQPKTIEALASPLKPTPLPDVPRPEKRLRGCIGHVWPDTPLYEVVQEMAVAAATRDPRLPPVTPEEVGQLRLEISVLSPLYSVTELKQIKVGIHGLLLTQGKQRGLLLPEVPVERGWGRETFLAALCRKAGLPRHAWPEQAILYTFTTLKFGE